MISRPRMPHFKHSTVVLVLAVAALAFPLGALANHQFSDVATSASYHDDVEALVAHGITSGCGGGQYCPGDPVTRGQMAQFLNRLGNLDGNTAPSVDADMVDGKHANSLSRAALGTPAGGVVLTGAYQSLGSVTITAPVAGFVVVTGSTTVYSFDAGCPCEVHVGLSTTAVPSIPNAWSNARVGIDAGSTDVATIAVPHVFSVAAGVHTFYLTGLNFNAGSGAASATFQSIVAQFTPFGATGGPTLASSEGPSMSTDTQLSE